MNASGASPTYLIFWALAAYGITLVITGSKLTRPLRRLFKPLASNAAPASKDNLPLPVGPVRGFFGTLFECPMCMGFWVGLALSFAHFGPSSSLLLHANGSLAHIFDGFSSVSVCWAFHVILVRLGALDL